MHTVAWIAASARPASVSGWLLLQFCGLLLAWPQRNPRIPTVRSIVEATRAQRFFISAHKVKDNQNICILPILYANTPCQSWAAVVVAMARTTSPSWTLTWSRVFWGPLWRLVAGLMQGSLHSNFTQQRGNKEPDKESAPQSPWIYSHCQQVVWQSHVRVHWTLGTSSESKKRQRWGDMDVNGALSSKCFESWRQRRVQSKGRTTIQYGLLWFLEIYTTEVYTNHMGY